MVESKLKPEAFNSFTAFAEAVYETTKSNLELIGNVIYGPYNQESLRSQATIVSLLKLFDMPPYSAHLQYLDSVICKELDGEIKDSEHPPAARMRAYYLGGILHQKRLTHKSTVTVSGEEPGSTPDDSGIDRESNSLLTQRLADFEGQLDTLVQPPQTKDEAYLQVKWFECSMETRGEGLFSIWKLRDPSAYQRWNDWRSKVAKNFYKLPVAEIIVEGKCDDLEAEFLELLYGAAWVPAKKAALSGNPKHMEEINKYFFNHPEIHSFFWEKFSLSVLEEIDSQDLEPTQETINNEELAEFTNSVLARSLITVHSRIVQEFIGQGPERAKELFDSIPIETYSARERKNLFRRILGIIAYLKDPRVNNGLESTNASIVLNRLEEKAQSAGIEKRLEDEFAVLEDKKHGVVHLNVKGEAWAQTADSVHSQDALMDKLTDQGFTVLYTSRLLDDEALEGEPVLEEELVQSPISGERQFVDRWGQVLVPDGSVVPQVLESLCQQIVSSLPADDLFDRVVKEQSPKDSPVVRTIIPAFFDKGHDLAALKDTGIIAVVPLSDNRVQLILDGQALGFDCNGIGKLVLKGRLAGNMLEIEGASGDFELTAPHLLLTRAAHLQRLPFNEDALSKQEIAVVRGHVKDWNSGPAKLGQFPKLAFDPNQPVDQQAPHVLFHVGRKTVSLAFQD